MVYITGDTHGDFSRYIGFSSKMKPTDRDTMIVLGDAGLNYFGDLRDDLKKDFVNDFPFITFCIHGNHEMRPTEVKDYITREYCGGQVWYQAKYPNILFAKDGEIYNFDGYSCIVMGGAYSVDKYYRLARGWQWFESEQPTEEIKEYVESQLKRNNNKIDIILSHTCPIKYEPIEVFVKGINQSEIDKSTEEWLDKIENKNKYKKWYCGHYHTIKKVDKIEFMFENIDILSEKELKKI